KMRHLPFCMHPRICPRGTDQIDRMIHHAADGGFEEALNRRQFIVGRLFLFPRIGNELRLPAMISRAAVSDGDFVTLGGHSANYRKMRLRALRAVFRTLATAAPDF